MRQIPDTLPAVRILLSFLLLVLTKDTALLLVVCFIVGINDILDGWLARFLHVQSELGVRLNSIDDLAFYYVSLYITLFQMNLKIMDPISTLMLCIFVLKLAALPLTRWKHHIWASIHTIGNRLIGLLLFLLVPFYVVAGSLPLIPVTLVIACSHLATFGEILLALSRNTYDISTKSLLEKQKAGLQLQRRLSDKKRVRNHKTFSSCLIRKDLPIRIRAFLLQMLDICARCLMSIRDGFLTLIGRESAIHTSSLSPPSCIRTNCTLQIHLYFTSFIWNSM